MAYSIEIAPAAERQLKAIRSKTLQQRIVDHILELKTNPRPPGIEKMQGSEEDLYRLRVGDYRIIHHIQDQASTILVVKIGHRKDIYRRL
jgi:mRNA interferase RelE/StbE